MTGRFTVDDLARPVALGCAARRVVCLAPSCTECLLAIGGADRLVGVDDHSEVPDGDALARIGGFKTADAGRILALAPDLVVAASLHAVSLVPPLAAAGLRVFVTRPQTVNAIVDGMARLAGILGIADKAAAHLTRCHARVDAVVERSIRSRHRPLVYVELSPDGHTGGPQSFLDDLVTKAGGVNLGGVGRVEWPRLSHRLVRRLDPDVIVIARYPGSASPDTVAKRDGWAAVSAVTAGRVIEFPAGMVKRPGPGVIDGLERLANVIDHWTDDQSVDA